MALSKRPLGYCGNVHPGLTVAAVVQSWDNYVLPVQARVGQPVAAGLWLPQPVTAELLATPSAVPQFARELAERGLTCDTLNAFPYGNFHSDRVKEQVYLPDWTTAERRDYTLACAKILAALRTDGAPGSISTVPLGFKTLAARPTFVEDCIERLLETAAGLEQLEQQTGQLIRIGLEPEPGCVLETTEETIAFFERLWSVATKRGVEPAAWRYLGVCYDVCHQAVEFEDVAESIHRLDQADVPIVKVHLTCAVEVDNPATSPEVRDSLQKFIEPRYLHQTYARTAGGALAKQLDLDAALIDSPPADFASADVWRVHFHVPVDAEVLGPLRTTRPALRAAIDALALIEQMPHLEVETYTWGVLPGGAALPLVEGLARELIATHELLAREDLQVE